MLEAGFWASLGLLVYAYVGYPLALAAAASLWQLWRDLRFALRRSERRRIAAAGPQPPVSMVFAAYNEQAVIAAKMANCAAIEYAGPIEILVGGDACSDATVELARLHAPAGTRVMDYRERSGKPGVLNQLMQEAGGEIVVFCDANTMFEPGTVQALVRHFSDPAVGCVCGELRLVAPGGGATAERTYWRYEGMLKFLESRLNMLVGANGGVFAIRRELFRPIPARGIIDDFLVAMSVRGQGYRVVYDPEAVGVEEAPAAIEQEFRRRVRIGAGNWHALRYTWRLLLPWAGAVAFSYWSHKVCRWLCPFALAIGGVCALGLAARPWYAAAAALGFCGLAAAWAGYRLERRGARSRLVAVPYYFVSMNLALLVGFWRFLTGGQGTAWGRTARKTGAGG